MGTSSAGGMGPATRVLRLSAEHLAQLEAMAEGAWPCECCGVLVGSRTGSSETDVRDVWLTRNTAGDRRRRYQMAPEDLVSAQRLARSRGLQIVGYFHSHPDRRPVPSDLDVREAWPDLSYLIFEVRHGRSRGARCWRVENGQALVEEIETVQSVARYDS